ncbi:MAG: rod shape-determining protein MreD [Rikenellaceae bacterium]|jgi:hypothetical protein|nr:rod shape-determining protein MreD [Rikenellaceae bacterium]
MNYILRYTVLFAVAIALQLFLFDSLNLGAYVHPLFYIVFIVLLPMNLRGFWLLVLGLLLGVTMDVATGSAGLHTIATLAVAYSRRFVLNIIIGREYVNEGGVPSPKSIGSDKFLRYAAIVVFLQCTIFFAFEAMNWHYFYLVALKIALSGALTLLFVWLTALLFTARERKKI